MDAARARPPAVRRRVHRVLVPRLEGGSVALRGPEAHHLRDVLRVKPGAVVEAFDGAGRVAPGQVAAVDRDGVTLALEEPRASAVEAGLAVTVAVALLKGDKLSDVVRQGTELGARRFQLLVTRHADASSLSPARLQRLRRVAEEAARQSGRAIVPDVTEPLPLAELTWEGGAIVAEPEADGTLAALLAEGAWRAGPLTTVTGPEGGFAPDEVEALVARGARAVRFGPRVLRAETAPVALAAALLLSAEA